MSSTMPMPPFAAPLRDALDALASLRARMTAAEARAASAAERVHPLATAYEDALAAGSEAPDDALQQAEADKRRATAEAAGLRRMMAKKRDAIRGVIAACEHDALAMQADMEKRLDGRLKMAATKLLDVMAEVSALRFAMRDYPGAHAAGQVRIPTSLYEVPDAALWHGATGLQGDAQPIATDALHQLGSAMALVQQARHEVSDDQG